MAADRVEVTSRTSALGEIVSGGRLVDCEGRTLAGFQQTYQLWRGSRVLLIQIELDPQEEPRRDPWNSYYACRFAWADVGADLFRSVHLSHRPTGARRFEAPHYVEIQMPGIRTAILTGGLPYHRRVGYRMLDSLLIVRGETMRRFRLGIGIDVSHPLQEALSLLTPQTFLSETAPPPAPNQCSWLFHLDAKNVTATHWEPIVEDGRATGFRARILETAGRSGRVGLRCFRPVARARQVDFRGQPLGDCQVAEGQIQIDIGAHEWVEVEARWNRNDG